MAFEANPAPPSRDKSLERMVGILRIAHDVKQKEHDKLQIAIRNMIMFGNKPLTDDKKIYQYIPENQKEFWDNGSVIQSASSAIQPVVNRQKTTLFETEMRVPTDTQTIFEQEPKKKEVKDEQSFFQKLTGKKTKRMINTNDPYQSSVKQFENELKVLNQIELFFEYQSYGMKKARRGVRTSILSQYKDFHYNRFFKISTPLTRLHRMYIDDILSDEKKYAVAVSASLDKELYRKEQTELQKQM